VRCAGRRPQRIFQRQHLGRAASAGKRERAAVLTNHTWYPHGRSGVCLCEAEVSVGAEPAGALRGASTSSAGTSRRGSCHMNNPSAITGPVRIRPLVATDAVAYKALRDEALRTAPDAFTSDYESSVGRDASEYVARFGTLESGRFFLGA